MNTGGENSQTDQLKSLRRKAREFNRNEEWDLKAVELNTMIIELDPDDVAAHCRRGKCRRHRGELEDAEADYRCALELSPEGSATIPHIEEAIREIGAEGRRRDEQKREAAAERERRERERRSELESQQQLLERLHTCGQAVEAARRMRSEPDPDLEFVGRVYERAVTLDPSRLDVGVEWAALLRETGNTRKALRIYDRVLELHPGYRAARVGRAAVMVDEGDPNAALKACDELLAENPSDAYARRVKARAHAARGEMPEAVWEFEHAGD